MRSNLHAPPIKGVMSSRVDPKTRHPNSTIMWMHAYQFSNSAGKGGTKQNDIAMVRQCALPPLSPSPDAFSFPSSPLLHCYALRSNCGDCGGPLRRSDYFAFRSAHLQWCNHATLNQTDNCSLQSVVGTKAQCVRAGVGSGDGDVSGLRHLILGGHWDCRIIVTVPISSRFIPCPAAIVDLYADEPSY